MRIVTLCLVSLCLVSCGSSLPRYDYSKEPDPRTSEYVIGPSDELDINVWKNPDLSTRPTVRPDGTITMPLIGDLHAAGKTPTQLKQDIREELSRYIKLEGVEITIAVTEVNSYRFTVSGEVTQPGMFSAPRYVTVAEAVAMAGGLTRFARQDELVLTRRDPVTGALRRIPLSYRLIAGGNRPDMNLVLLSGDALHVP